tara:strand:+ start:216 stop:950 length:735 start_codon:yes stop_codon:yes gene_type:complete
MNIYSNGEWSSLSDRSVYKFDTLGRLTSYLLLDYKGLDSLKFGIPNYKKGELISLKYRSKWFDENNKEDYLFFGDSTLDSISIFKEMYGETNIKDTTVIRFFYKNDGSWSTILPTKKSFGDTFNVVCYYSKEGRLRKCINESNFGRTIYYHFEGLNKIGTDSTGKVISRDEIEEDKFGNIIKRRRFYRFRKKLRIYEEVNYEYKFDSKGNWVEKKAKGLYWLGGFKGKGTPKDYFFKREILYYN